VAFLSILASGLIDETKPGVTQVLGWLRGVSRNAAVHAIGLESELEAVASVAC
jgi:hypothetical protein